MILIEAYNIRSGGTVSLLNYLIRELSSFTNNFMVAIDERNDLIQCSEKFLIKHSFNKFNRSRILKKAINYCKPTTLFCFGNFPPTFKLKGIRVITLVHNMHLILPSFNRDIYSALQIIKLKLLKGYFQYCLSNSDIFIFQTNFVKNTFLNTFINSQIVALVIPFFNSTNRMELGLVQENAFIYVSSGEPHKNHLNLFKAWNILNENKYRPILYTTLSDDQFINIKSKFPKLNNIINLGFMNMTELHKRLNLIKYSIFPSTLETIGLGLIESINAKCKVICSNLPFVEEVICPSLSFDPYDSQDIADKALFALTEELPESSVILQNKIEDLLELLLCELSQNRIIED